jgi:hypothetical protein
MKRSSSHSISVLSSSARLINTVVYNTRQLPSLLHLELLPSQPFAPSVEKVSLQTSMEYIYCTEYSTQFTSAIPFELTTVRICHLSWTEIPPCTAPIAVCCHGPQHRTVCSFLVLRVSCIRQEVYSLCPMYYTLDHCRLC